MAHSAESVVAGEQGRLGAPADAELGEDRVEFVVDGLAGDAEPRRDRGGGDAGREHVEDLVLARRQRGERVRRPARLDERAVGDAGPEEGRPGGDGADGPDDLLARVALEDVAGGTG